MYRIINEFKDLARNPLSNCGLTVGLENEDDYRLWKCSLFGPKDISYRGGLFYFYAQFPESYPSRPPEVYFGTPIYHLNINPRAPKSNMAEPLGHISISTLNWWKPVLIFMLCFIWLILKVLMDLIELKNIELIDRHMKKKLDSLQKNMLILLNLPINIVELKIGIFHSEL